MKRAGWLTAWMMMATAVLCASAMAAAPDSVRLNNEGVAMYEKADFAGALNKFNDALKLDPRNVAIQNNVGYAYIGLGDNDKAGLAFRRSLELDPANIEAHSNLGVVFYNGNQKDKAIAEWQLALRLDPSNEAARRNIDIASTEGAKPNLPQAAPGTYEESVARFDAGKMAFRDGNFGVAAIAFEAVLAATPGSFLSRYYLGVCYAKLGKRDAALYNLREYLFDEAYPPQCPECFDHARETYAVLTGNLALRGNPVTPAVRGEALFQKGKKAYQEGDFFTAIKHLRPAAEFMPNSYDINYLLGVSYSKVGDPQRAVFHLTRCLLAGPGSRTIMQAQDVAFLLKRLTGVSPGYLPE